MNANCKAKVDVLHMFHSRYHLGPTYTTTDKYLVLPYIYIYQYATFGPSLDLALFWRIGGVYELITT